MSDKAKETGHLADAVRHIADGEVRLNDQETLVRRLAADGHDRTAAQKLLDTFRDTLATMRMHRALILQELGKPPRRLYRPRLENGSGCQFVSRIGQFAPRHASLLKHP
jgi:hypothetical protein